MAAPVPGRKERSTGMRCSQSMIRSRRAQGMIKVVLRRLLLQVVLRWRRMLLPKRSERHSGNHSHRTREQRGATRGWRRR